jgi:hypothetical protein
VQAPPGVPVASQLARSELALGFQQMNEPLHAEGIALLGEMSAAVRSTTVFSAPPCVGTAHRDGAHASLATLPNGTGVVLTALEHVDVVAAGAWPGEGQLPCIGLFPHEGGLAQIAALTLRGKCVQKLMSFERGGAAVPYAR